MQARPRHGGTHGSKAQAFASAFAWSRRGTIGLVALIAFLLQVFTASTHWHWSQTASLGGVPVHGISAGGEVSSDQQHQLAKTEICQLCQAMSGAARFLAASAPLTPKPQSVAVAWHTGATQDAILIRLSHAWRGRAPPVQFEIT